MIDQKFRETQIRRMGGLDNYPSFEPGGYAELLRVAGKCARSEEHLRQVMDEIMDTATKCPKPSELKALLEVGKPEAPVKLACPLCEGSGWMVAKNGGATRCTCGSVPQPAGAAVPYDKREKPAQLEEFLLAEDIQKQFLL